MAGISSICPGLVLDRLSSRHWHAVAAHPGHILWAGGLSLVQFRVRQNVDCLKINVSWLFRNKYELCNVPLKFFLYPSFPFSGRTISITFSLFMMRLGIIGLWSLRPNACTRQASSWLCLLSLCWRWQSTASRTTGPTASTCPILCLATRLRLLHMLRWIICFFTNRFLKTEIRDSSIFSIFIFNVLILFVTQVSSLGITDVGEIGKKIAMLPKENGSTSRLVFITQASDPVIVVQHGKA